MMIKISSFYDGKTEDRYIFNGDIYHLYKYLSMSSKSVTHCKKEFASKSIHY